MIAMSFVVARWAHGHLSITGWGLLFIAAFAGGAGATVKVVRDR